VFVLTNEVGMKIHSSTVMARGVMSLFIKVFKASPSHLPFVICGGILW